MELTHVAGFKVPALSITCWCLLQAVIKIVSRRAPSDLQRGEVETKCCLLVWHLETQRDDTHAKGTCFPEECRVLAVALRGRSTAVLWPKKGGIPAALERWLLAPSQCRAPLSFPWVCLTMNGELQCEGSIFILVQSSSWVTLQGEKSFTAFYFSLHSLLVFHFSSQFCSSQPLWTKHSEREISVRFCCIIFPSPGNEGLLFPPREV